MCVTFCWGKMLKNNRLYLLLQQASCPLKLIKTFDIYNMVQCWSILILFITKWVSIALAMQNNGAKFKIHCLINFYQDFCNFHLFETVFSQAQHLAVNMCFIFLPVEAIFFKIKNISKYPWSRKGLYFW